MGSPARPCDRVPGKRRPRPSGLGGRRRSRREGERCRVEGDGLAELGRAHDVVLPGSRSRPAPRLGRLRQGRRTFQSACPAPRAPAEAPGQSGRVGAWQGVREGCDWQEAVMCPSSHGAAPPRRPRPGGSSDSGRPSGDPPEPLLAARRGEEAWRGARPRKAANSRPDLNMAGSVTLADNPLGQIKANRCDLVHGRRC